MISVYETCKEVYHVSKRTSMGEVIETKLLGKLWFQDTHQVYQQKDQASKEFGYLDSDLIIVPLNTTDESHRRREVVTFAEVEKWILIQNSIVGIDSDVVDSRFDGVPEGTQEGFDRATQKIVSPNFGYYIAHDGLVYRI